MTQRDSGLGDRAGFTVAEVTLILVVLAVLFALLLPRMSAFLRRGQLRSAVAELTEAHDLARASAIRFGRPVELHLDAVRGTFWVEADTSMRRGGRDTVGAVHRISSDGITMTSTRAVLCFDRRGLGYSGGDCEPPDALITFSLSGRTETIRTNASGQMVR
jgi:Tfp pilus assembly protein FimT